MNYIFKLAEMNDIDKIFKIYQNVVFHLRKLNIDQWDEVYPTKEILRNDIEEKSLFVVFDTLNNIPISSIVINESQEPEYKSVNWANTKGKICVIHRFCVEPVFQRRGIGNKTLLSAEDYIMKKRYSSIRLDAFTENLSALNFYKRNGYVFRGQVVFRKGIFNCYEKIFDY
ncbi:GNAT family N-acetyltransferase [Sporanaerobacter sp. PP17-6a]|uniref:GNAT family N-acetyltransferase n=1 Tax=Sporanaerobacter sp. PP17-6a TaxID=1891289 RepID=UPI00089FD6E0|nr:GNAT family N-acetyltransferase [Sporanaerobacter sp. PP17-6a]MBE6082904.1 GNAT family N-acetyltransferase [Tissierellaceae bacterium]SCL82095.1 putative acetyltransferase [Sporanaerobacter sp. PP17-6a]